MVGQTRRCCPRLKHLCCIFFLASVLAIIRRFHDFSSPTSLAYYSNDSDQLTAWKSGAAELQSQGPFPNVPVDRWLPGQIPTPVPSSPVDQAKKTLVPPDGQQIPTPVSSSPVDQAKKYLVPPDGQPYAFRKYGVTGKQKSFSQFGQSKWVDQVLLQMQGGFVVESGALDGESHSNSIFFEVARNWSCLLIEANPALQKKILSIHRRCHLLKGGLSITQYASSFKFVMAQAVGGIVDTMSKGTLDGIQKKIKSGAMTGSASSGEIVTVPCFPLHVIAAATGNLVIDYWSLDTEGSEPQILEATDFTKIEVGVITVEHQNSKARRNRIHTRLAAAGFLRAVAGQTDDFYVNTHYFEKRRLQLPKAV